MADLEIVYGDQRRGFSKIGNKAEPISEKVVPSSEVFFLPHSRAQAGPRTAAVRPPRPCARSRRRRSGQYHRSLNTRLMVLSLF